MTTIYELNITNFRGVNTFSQKFKHDFVCLLGRGDSGKTTILDAISLALSPIWNPTFIDSDFHNGKVAKPITIEISLLDPPDKLITMDKFGPYIRGLDAAGNIHDELQDDHKKVLTIKLEVKKDLEPQWHVIHNSHEPKQISAADRAKFNVFMVSDYVDRHFSWSKGNPLYSILKENQPLGEEKNDVIIGAIREAKGRVDQNGFAEFNSVTDKIRKASSYFGIDLSGIRTTVDFKDIFVKDGKVCLHDRDVPFRLKGKGTKRLVSMAIQTVLAQYGGVILIDEIEQGLEPDRVKHLVRSLKRDNHGQIFVTTHSCEVITELLSEDLTILNNNGGNIGTASPSEKYQDIIRACPEAAYAKKVIVCEGSTEIGICRALDVYRKSNSQECMSLKDCVYTIGQGTCFTTRAMKLKELGLKVCVFCDSDNDANLQPTKEDLMKSGIDIFDCESGNAIEHQVFQDLPWNGVLKLLDYTIKHKKINEEQLLASIQSQYNGIFPKNLRNTDTTEIRQAIGKASLIEDKKWFKRIDHGEYLGTIIFNHFGEIGDNKIRKQLEKLSNWIDA